MKIPINLLLFLAVAGVFYLVILPKKTRFVANLMESMGVKSVSREDTVKAMVAFPCDGANRKFPSRRRQGSISEILDLL